MDSPFNANRQNWLKGQNFGREVVILISIVELTYIAWSKVTLMDVSWSVKTFTAWHSKFDQDLISGSRTMAAWTDVTRTNVSWTNVAWTDVAWTIVARTSIYWPNPYKICTIFNDKCCQELINNSWDMATWTSVTWTIVTGTNVNGTTVTRTHV